MGAGLNCAPYAAGHAVDYRESLGEKKTLGKIFVGVSLKSWRKW